MGVTINVVWRNIEKIPLNFSCYYIHVHVSEALRPSYFDHLGVRDCFMWLVMNET